MIKKVILYYKASWKRNWPWTKKMGIHIFFPSIIWLALIGILIEIVSGQVKREMTDIFVPIGMVGFYAIWIIGFHRAKLLSKENPSYIGSHILYGFTLVHLGMFLVTIIIL